MCACAALRSQALLALCAAVTGVACAVLRSQALLALADLKVHGAQEPCANHGTDRSGLPGSAVAVEQVWRKLGLISRHGPAYTQQVSTQPQGNAIVLLGQGSGARDRVTFGRMCSICGLLLIHELENVQWCKWPLFLN